MPKAKRHKPRYPAAKRQMQKLGFATGQRRRESAHELSLFLGRKLGLPPGKPAPSKVVSRSFVKARSPSGEILRVGRRSHKAIGTSGGGRERGKLARHPSGAKKAKGRGTSATGGKQKRGARSGRQKKKQKKKKR